ncbi:SDR family oxidoreductase [Pseudochrobactrum asaccharolyticum]|uniref:NAD(P)H dehydrogenase (Quinone) n=1 Tax=Pseudochrobactrum asaccharolyticum TaxID=354351 RepID=A0A366DLK6_9HYPH|nr:SDR family oxidoreductase [Pseudochrobactrum asaccharolyticum]RBO90941.1 NAD(P)H dehydrogenase (quinone) [Pseudochrobactrum asaccharolyticum]
MAIAITGATGKLGRLVVQKLKARIEPSSIVAIARDLTKCQELGVTARQGDYDQPEQLFEALVGIEAVLLISSSVDTGRVRHHRNVINAAMKAGVQRIVYTSTLHADWSPIGSASDHLATERALRGSGRAITILRNGWYTENYASSFRSAIASGILYGCAGDGKFSSASRADYADAAVEALIGVGHDDRTYELAGDSSYTLADAAAKLSLQTGKRIVYRNLPDTDYVAALIKAGIPEATAIKIASFDVAASNGALFHDGGQLSALIGHSTETLAKTISFITLSNIRGS